MKNKKKTYILDIISGQIYLQISKDREMKKNNRLQHQQPQQQQRQLEEAVETKEETLMMRTKWQSS